MRKALLAFCLLIANTFCLVQPANAAITGEGIFGAIGGTTTIDQGGAVHSQARSIYSLGGGMTSFKSKKVSLVAVDPPGFSAGCSGISWHFGGFSFISADEIRQLVEAVAQASLGIAVDLAMQTLCPQCYAVMSKLRDISNAMRNAAADSCKIAQHFGDLLKSTGAFKPYDRNESCAQMDARTNANNSFLGSLASGACKLADDASKAVGKGVSDWNNWVNGTPPADGKTPTADMGTTGNVTYKALTNLGFKDGLAKDFILSYTGMTVLLPAAEDCSGPMKNVKATPKGAESSSTAGQAISDNTDPVKGQIETQPDGSGGKVDGNTTVKPTVAATDAKKGPQTCNLPPLLTKSNGTALDNVGTALVCGFDPRADAITFGRRFISRGPMVGTDEGNLAKLQAFSIGLICGITSGDAAKQTVPTKDFYNAKVYSCRTQSDCEVPLVKTIKEVAEEDGKASTSGYYSGVGWMVLDAMYSGVAAIRAGNQNIPPETLKLINGSGYPLYRLLNLAAVYPGMADELIQSYSAKIAVHYTLDMMDKLMRPGSNPAFQVTPKLGVAPGELSRLREEISNHLKDNATTGANVLARFHEKRALVDAIVQVNRSIQAEVMSMGLSQNNSMGVSLKRQLNAAGK